MNINDYLTHIDNPEDFPFLKTKLFDVNIRLCKSNLRYRQVILEALHLLSFAALTKMDGYKLPHGMSGANIGIPFNIIAIVQDRGTVNAHSKLMINPKIMQYAGNLIECKTNCGSIRLKKPITIRRLEKIKVSYYCNLSSGIEYREEWFNREEGSLTITHEIDHNLGILITDHFKV